MSIRRSRRHRSCVSSSDAQYTGDLDVDPSHELTNVNEQLFGTMQRALVRRRAQYRVRARTTHGSSDKDHNFAVGPNIMKCFDPAKLPVLTHAGQ